MKKMVNGKIVEMTQAEEKAFEESRKPTLESLKNQRISVRKTYLKETDWHTARSFDTGVAYAQEIKDKRTLARQEINEIELATETTISNYL